MNILLKFKNQKNLFYKISYKYSKEKNLNKNIS